MGPPPRVFVEKEGRMNLGGSILRKFQSDGAFCVFYLISFFDT